MARRRRRRRRKAQQKRMLVIGIAVVALILIGYLLTYSITKNKVNKVAADRIANNIFIEDVDVSGMKAKEAEEALNERLEEYKKDKITLVAETSKADVSLGSLGFSFGNVDQLVKKALAYGKSGSVFARNRELKKLKTEPFKMSTTYSVEASAVRNVVSKEIPKLENGAQDATIKRENGQFVVTEGKTGKKIDLEKAVTLIEEYLEKEWSLGDKGTVTLTTILDEPNVTGEQLRKIKNALGSFSTTFVSGSSRGKNIILAVSRINGTLLLPGEEFSANTVMQSRDAAHGYFEAGSYLNGEVVQSYGGGVCQVSTTLYNAVLLSELEVTQRSPHSMLVDYVKPSMDAAIAEGSKDFKFKNNTGAPVFIEGYTSGGRMTFTIFGQETRASSRQIYYESETISSSEPVKKFVATGDAVGVIKKQTSPHIGTKAKLWKVIKENGVEKERVQVNTSSYGSAPGVWGVGTATDNAEAKNIVTKAIASQNEATIQEAVNKAKAMTTPATPATPAAPTTPTTPTTPTEGGGSGTQSGGETN